MVYHENYPSRWPFDYSVYPMGHSLDLRSPCCAFPAGSTEPKKPVDGYDLQRCGRISIDIWGWVKTLVPSEPK